MSLEDLKKQFIVNEDARKALIEPIVSKALNHCRVDKNGHVLITNAQLTGKERVKLALAARTIAAQLDPDIRAEVTLADLAKYTGLPINQVRARMNDVVREKFVESLKAGVYRARLNKVRVFLDSLPTPAETGPTT
jgi:hypothetical protein